MTLLAGTGMLVAPIVLPMYGAPPVWTQLMWSANLGQTFSTSPPLSWGPTPPSPFTPWQVAQLLVNKIEPAVTGSFTLGGVRLPKAPRYTIPQMGRAIRTGRIQNGVLGRVGASRGSGSGSAATGARPPPARPAPPPAWVAGGADPATTGDVAFGVSAVTAAACSVAVASPSAPSAPLGAARRSPERRSRCSGISVTSLPPGRQTTACDCRSRPLPTTKRGPRQRMGPPMCRRRVARAKPIPVANAGKGPAVH